MGAPLVRQTDRLAAEAVTELYVRPAYSPQAARFAKVPAAIPQATPPWRTPSAMVRAPVFAPRLQAVPPSSAMRRPATGIALWTLNVR